MSNFLKVLRDIALLFARVALGGVLVAHAWQRWQGDGGVDRQIAYLTSFGVPWPDYVAGGTIIGEGVAGLMLILGLLTPVAAAGVVAEQVLIISWISWRNGLYLTDRGWEYQLVLGVLALIFVVYGAGRASIDSVFRRTGRDRYVDDTMAP